MDRITDGTNFSDDAYFDFDDITNSPCRILQNLSVPWWFAFLPRL